jgi:aromatic ring-cleaving dioxygenase
MADVGEAVIMENEVQRITGYHTQVYYEDAGSRAIAAELRDAIAARFEVVRGRPDRRPRTDCKRGGRLPR